MLAKINEEKELQRFSASAIVHASARISSLVKMKVPKMKSAIKSVNRLAVVPVPVTVPVTATFREDCQAECVRLEVERLTPSQVAGIREARRIAAAAAAGVAMTGRVAISVGKETVHLSSGTSRVRVLFGRQATPREVADALRAQISALEVRSAAFTGELAHRAAGRIATLKSRLASL